AGQRRLPSSCNTKSSTPKRTMARPKAAAHCHEPYSSGGVSSATKTAGAALGGAHEGVAHLDALHRLSQAEAQVPHPLTGDLPQLLPTLAVGTPAIGIFFDIFIGQHRLESSTPMIEIQHILHQEPL